MLMTINWMPTRNQWKSIQLHVTIEAFESSRMLGFLLKR